MKKILPVLAMLLMLISLGFNTGIARLLDSQISDEEFVAFNTEVQDLKVSVYPNPVINNRINITANQDIKSVKLLTIVGSVILEEEYKTGITTTQIDLNELGKGLYLLKISFDEEKTYTEKIMVK
ncbi:MAG: T9SS type A sorting domain-containing protein [Bacteroidales bacterium]|nr:T9SS type A sorting domain-containing protein [Bacteroidales bacterium]